jgi:predicted dehydrogenase
MSTTRRGFTTAAAQAAIAYRFVEGGGQLRAAGPDLGFGFVGIGIRGMYLFEDFRKMPGVKPLIVADSYDGHLTRAKELTDGTIETTRDYRRVLDRKDVDVVVIATPDHWHRRMALDALSAGKHVYLEKPMAWSIEQNIEIAQAVDGAKLLLQVGSGAKTSAVTAKAREIVKSGQLGKITMVRMEMHRNSPEGAWVYAVPPDASPETVDWNSFLGPAPKRPFRAETFFRWRCWWEYSGGVATDLFVHMLTQLHEVMDVPAPKSVVSQGGLFHWKDGRTVPDVLNSIYYYPNDLVADLYVNLCNAQGGRGMTVMGTDATMQLSMRGITIQEENKSHDVQRYATAAWPEKMRREYFASRGYSPEGRALNPPPPAKKPQEVTIERGLSHTQHFLVSLREGKPTRENAWDGHAAAGAAHLANLAYLKGRRLGWDWKTGKVSDS